MKPTDSPFCLPARSLPWLGAASLGLIAVLGLSLGSAACNRNGRTASDTSGSGTPDTGSAPTAERFEIDVFAFGRQLGTIAPCGCTADPLGGLQYAFGYIEAESTPGQRLILEPGSFLFPDPEGAEAPVDAAAWAQAHQRAKLLQGRFSKLDGLVSGFGPTDLALPETGAQAFAELAMPRVLANTDAAPDSVETHRTVPLGNGLEAAVTAVIDPALADAARSSWAASYPEVGEPIAALKALAPKLNEADLQVVMVHGPRELAESIAREIEGLDVVVMGGEFHNPDRARLGTSPTQIGSAWILEPGDRAQTIAHLTLSLAGSVGEGELPGEWTLVPSAEQRAAELERLEEKLAKFADDPSADPRFIERLEADRDRLKAELENPGIPADVAAAVVPAQTKVSCRLPADEVAKSALNDYDGWVAEKNREAFAGVHAPEPEPGQPGYAGIEACADCHEEAVEFWNSTIHAKAYGTLVEANKQYDLSCVGCHVTGFRELGGSEVVENAHLQSVQCEQCHGPGSLHVEDPSTDNIQLEAPAKVCLACHTPEHSDTFAYEPYLRDILGEGHGADARAKLGEGETAKQLRAAAIEAAGGGCPKM